MAPVLKTAVDVNNLTDSERKHIPYISYEGKTVTVSCGYGIIHPMTEEHYIIYFELFQNGESIGKTMLKPGDKSEVRFTLDSIENLSAHAFCNEHGIWASL